MERKTTLLGLCIMIGMFYVNPCFAETNEGNPKTPKDEPGHIVRRSVRHQSVAISYEDGFISVITVRTFDNVILSVQGESGEYIEIPLEILEGVITIPLSLSVGDYRVTVSSDCVLYSGTITVD